VITRADVADLREGDVVRLKWELAGVPGVTFTATGPLAQCYGVLAVGGYGVRTSTGAPARPSASLTVVSRAPRPLYVNSDRTEPVPGDVVRDADDDSNPRTWVAGHDAGRLSEWRSNADGYWFRAPDSPPASASWSTAPPVSR
jgi:hypothetical protein